jgi:hypothetical protein
MLGQATATGNNHDGDRHMTGSYIDELGPVDYLVVEFPSSGMLGRGRAGRPGLLGDDRRPFR